MHARQSLIEPSQANNHSRIGPQEQAREQSLASHNSFPSKSIDVFDVCFPSEKGEYKKQQKSILIALSGKKEEKVVLGKHVQITSSGFAACMPPSFHSSIPEPILLGHSQHKSLPLIMVDLPGGQCLRGLSHHLCPLPEQTLKHQNYCSNLMQSSE